MPDIFDNLSKIYLDEKFIYIAALLLFLFVATRFDVKLNLVFGFSLGMLFIYFKFKKDVKTVDEAREVLKKRLDQIEPKPKNFANYEDIINFVFSIQDLASFNPKNYGDCIRSIDTFLGIYEDVLVGVSLCSQNWDVADDKRKAALESLQGLIYSVDSNYALQNKIKDAYEELNRILLAYLRRMAIVCNRQIRDHGYNYLSKPIPDETYRPFNYLIDNPAFTTNTR